MRIPNSDISNRVNRTWLCCVIFTDIVGYSKQSTRSQMAIKEVFDRHLTEALKETSANDLIILDLGDGAAICLSDPEEALFACLSVQGSFAKEESIPNFDFKVRIGINLGSVKLIKDLNGNLNAVGDGINVAQRVMSFAGPNQILVSRSFYEVASSLSEEYPRLFSYEGVRTDKHVKEHSVYALAPPEQILRPAATVDASSTSRLKEITPFPSDLLKKVEGKLASILGPIAKVLVKNATRTPAPWDSLVASLAEQIPTKKEKDDFLSFCQNAKTAQSSGPGFS